MREREGGGGRRNGRSKEEEGGAERDPRYDDRLPLRYHRIMHHKSKLLEYLSAGLIAQLVRAYG